MSPADKGGQGPGIPWVTEPNLGVQAGEHGALCWLQDGTVHLVYGILEQPFPSLEAINISILQTGLQRVQLLKPNISTPTLPSDMLTMEIRAPDVLVPGQETTYWCYISELPDGFARHHIVMVCRGPGPRSCTSSAFHLGPP